MKKYFITGGLGLIGYHITKQLIERGDSEVIIFDAQKHYIPLDKSNWPNYQLYRIKDLKHDSVTVLRGDCNDRGLLKHSLETYKPDVIIHLAALSIAGTSNEFPFEAKQNIYDSIANLLDVLKNVSFKFERIVYASSSMVYGNFNRDELGEIISATEDQQCNPIGVYGAMKLGGEYLVKVYHHRFGLPYVIVRPSAVYGPTDCNRRVTEIFLTNAINGKPLLLDNGGKHKLDFTYVSDIANGFILASDKKEALSNTFNITRGEGRELREFAQIIKSIIPKTIIESRNLTPYRPNRGALDITKAKELLGYSPKYSLEEGVREYYDFLLQTLK